MTYVKLLQNGENRKHIQKSQTYFFLYFQQQDVAYLLNQHKQLIDVINFCSALFDKVSSIKYVRWNKPICFYSESPLYALWEKK